VIHTAHGEAVADASLSEPSSMGNSSAPDVAERSSVRRVGLSALGGRLA
jgi:hypothetical protein